MNGLADTNSNDRFPNPYVGPRPFEPGEMLCGREREIRDLDNLLSAERIVLLHSPSGAGKSSLVQAGLLPQLKKSFDIFKITYLLDVVAVCSLSFFFNQTYLILAKTRQDDGSLEF